MKKVLLLILVLSISFIYVGCSKDSGEEKNSNSVVENESKESGSKENLKRIGLVLKQKGDVFNQVIKNTIVEKFDGKEYEIVVTEANELDTLVEEQIENIDYLVSQGVDGMIITPGHNTDLIPSLKKAQDKGIKMILVDSQIDVEKAKSEGLETLPLVTVDNYNTAYKSVKKAIEEIDIEVEALIITGPAEALNAQQRRDGAKKAIEENEKIKIVTEEDGSWELEKGYKITKEQFEKNSNIKVVVAANDQMALGALQYIKEKNIADVKIIGFDAIENAVEAVNNGEMTLTVEQDAETYGIKAVEELGKILNGDDIGEEILVEATIITKE
ncbi:MAG: sugar ABC transporter substrate-binding protein [Clostridiales bacterium]